MKNKVYKVLAAAFAMALVMTSPDTCITSHAFGFNADAGHNSEGGMDEVPDDYWSAWENESSGSSDSSASNESYSEPSYEAPSYSEPSHDSNSSNESYDNGGSSDNDSSYDSSSGTASAPATTSSKINTENTGAGKKGNDVTVNVTGGQSFRIVTASDRTSFQVYHCGISRTTFKVTDGNGNAVAFSSVVLEKGGDNLWYASIKFAEGVDTKDFAVTVTKGDATYLSANLGVSGIKISGALALSTVPATDAE